MTPTPTSDRGHAFERLMPRARDLAARGYSTGRVAMHIAAQCGSVEQAHLIARAAELANTVRGRKVTWLIATRSRTS